MYFLCFHYPNFSLLQKKFIYFYAKGNLVSKYATVSDAGGGGGGEGILATGNIHRYGHILFEIRIITFFEKKTRYHNISV